MRRILTLLPLLAAPVAAEPPTPAELEDAIEAYVAPFLADGHLSGTLLVARGDDVVFERSWGMASYELGVPNTPETRFCVASLTKPMTIAVVCGLAEQEKLHPDDPLSEWIPDFPRGDETTVSHLLNHRACIPHRVTTPKDETQPHTAADMVELVEKCDFLPYEPGEKSVYSSAGYSVLARVVELASGMTFDEALHEFLFRPAGMTHSGHTTHRALIPDRASPYFLSADGPINAPLQDLSFLVGAGSVHSTPRDLHRMIRAVVSETLGPVVPMALLKEEGMSWNGITNGFRAFAEYDRATDTSVIFAGNLLTGAGDYLRRDVPRIVAGEAVEAPERQNPEFAEVDESVLRGYEGVYQDPRGRTHTVRVTHGELYMSQWPLIPTSETTFYSPQDYGRVTVVFDDTGAVERLDWGRIEGTWPWRRTGDAEP